MQDQEIEQAKEFFKSPPVLYSPKELLENPKIIPCERGVYGWYFDVLPPTIPDDKEYIEINGYKLLYIGISGRQDNGKGNIRKRLLRNHLGKHSTGSSTLRRTLGKLLTDELALVKQPKGDRYWFGADGEAKLRNWMTTHAMIAFKASLMPKYIEAGILYECFQILALNKMNK